jgi:uncharacterized membrane protein
MKKTNGLAATSFGLGIASVFLFQLIVLPIAALVTGILGLSKFDEATQTGRWMAITGIVLGGLYGLLGSVRLLGF